MTCVSAHQSLCTQAMPIHRLHAFLLLTGATLTVGCQSSGLSAHDPGGEGTVSCLTALCQETPSAAATRERMHTPARVAVAQVGELAPPDELLAGLRTSPAFAAITGMPAPAPGEHVLRRGTPGGGPITRSDIDAYCNLAAATGADYLLLVGGTGDTVIEPTVLSVLDLTIIGMYIIPSRSMHADLRTVGALIEARSHRPIALRSAQTTGWKMITTAETDTAHASILRGMTRDASRDLAKAFTSDVP